MLQYPRMQTPNSGFWTRCNGHLMRSWFFDANGEVFWRCAKRETLDCSATAVGPVGELVESTPHDHELRQIK